MGGRANPPQDAAAFVRTGQTGSAEEIDTPEERPVAEADTSRAR
jgi:hypothetical protein